MFEAIPYHPIYHPLTPPWGWPGFLRSAAWRVLPRPPKRVIFGALPRRATMASGSVHPDGPARSDGWCGVGWCGQMELGDLPPLELGRLGGWGWMLGMDGWRPGDDFGSPKSQVPCLGERRYCHHWDLRRWRKDWRIRGDYHPNTRSSSQNEHHDYGLWYGCYIILNLGHDNGS